MAAYSLSGKAASDLDGIYKYTILNFGLEQARAYLLGLHERFQILANNPGVGRSAAQLAPELRRYEYQSHVVLYVLKESGVLIVRVLHSRMDAKRHFGETHAQRTPFRNPQGIRSRLRSGGHRGVCSGYVQKVVISAQCRGSTPRRNFQLGEVTALG